MMVATMRGTLFTCLVFVLPDPLLAGQQKSGTHRSDTSFVSCFDAPTGSKVVRSSVLESQDGRHRAYAEVQAVRNASKANEEPDALCKNSSSIFLAKGADAAYQRAYRRDSSAEFSGNAVRLVDWSPDGRQLLFELALWQYEAEGIYRTAVVIDTENYAVTDLDLDALVPTYFGKNCAVRFAVVGFSARADVVISARPLEGSEAEMGGVSCLKQRELWIFETAGKRAHRLQHEYSVKTYSHTIEGAINK